MLVKQTVKDEKRKLKPSELLKADTVTNAISQTYIDRTIESVNEWINTKKIIRNTSQVMTNEEAQEQRND
jgi:hypothetical protein